MSFSSNQGPATLSYVARTVKGSIPTEKVTFDAKKGENVKQVAIVPDPVIVFFPNGTSQIMSGADAESKGFLQTPDLLNIEAVNNTDSVAGRFKFALNDKDRRRYWLEMEQALISRCISKSGHPLPLDATFDDKSIYYQENVQ